MATKKAVKSLSKKSVRKKVSHTKKKAAKKTARKTAKRTTKTTSRKAGKKSAQGPKVLICAGNDECFWTTDGRILADLRELEAALNVMAEEVFSYHVSKEKNDFADWVENVLSDPACATDLRRSRKPNTAHRVVTRHLKLYA